MFPVDMSPKTLNIERLEKKFASLTRSRESIQGLSVWIIRHKEFYKEIVDQWLNALTRDFNALTMFYVANDVIQNCGRKKAPEFRDAFATVLEKAVSLQKVKEIKNEVTRMLTLWHDRAIYDDVFFKKLEDKLNNDVTEEEEQQEKELSEAEVIANYKLENLINSLKKLKTLEDELLEKESFLEDIEEPQMSNIDNIIVRMESQKEIQKFEKYQRLVEDYISLSDKVIAAKKIVLHDLKYSGIFYNAQLEDAKKVAHAYRIYGKKVKIVEKALLEKLSTFPEPSPPSPDKSPSLSPNSDFNTTLTSSPTPSTCVLLSENNKNNCEANITEACIIPKESEQELTENVLNEKSRETCDTVVSTQNSEIKVPEIAKNIGNDGSPEKNSESTPQSSCVNSSEVNPSMVATENTTVPDNVNSSVSTTASDKFETLSDIPSECIDFLLEKSYNEQVKCKSNFKRKIDNLLKLKQSKACKLASDQDTVDNSNDCKNSSESILTPGVSETEVKTQSSTQSTETISEEIKSETTSESSILKTDPPRDPKSSESVSVSDSTSKTPVSEQETLKISQSIEEVENVEMSNKSDTDAKGIQSSTSFAFQTLPDIPTELLKNILDKSRVNMNHPANADLSSFSDKATKSTSDITDKSSLSYNSNIDSTVSNLNPSTAAEALSSETSKSTQNDEKKCQELDDCSPTCSAVKDFAVSQNPIPNPQTVQSNNPSVNSTYFLDRLQNVLECFTKKETSFQGIKPSQTSNYSPSIPLENTLRIFNCLMQNGNKDSTTEPQLSVKTGFNSNNAYLGLSQKDMVNCGNFTSEIKRNLNENTLHDTNVKTEFTENFVFSSKDDNLEIMDMEVDSEDEGMK